MFTPGVVPKKEFKLSMGPLKWFDRFLTNDIEAQIRFLSRRRCKNRFLRPIKEITSTMGLSPVSVSLGFGLENRHQPIGRLRKLTVDKYDLQKMHKIVQTKWMTIVSKTSTQSAADRKINNFKGAANNSQRFE
jgi:hypothetical protein